MKEPGKIGIRTWIISIFLFVSGELLFTEAFAYFEPHVDGIEFRILPAPDRSLKKEQKKYDTI
jgi:hypothetical protein